jgi:hypothetical protein
MGLRISESVKIGPFRVRVSKSLTGRGRTWVSAGARTGRRGWTTLSVPLGGRRRR